MAETDSLAAPRGGDADLKEDKKQLPDWHYEVGRRL
jgi:hypothetical protein